MNQHRHAVVDELLDEVYVRGAHSAVVGVEVEVGGVKPGGLLNK